jgi:hypothetical protein
VQQLAAAGVVDLTLTSEELLQLAARDDWQPASAAAALTRGAFWTCYQPALETFLQVIGNVSAHAPAAVPAWLAAACHGLAASTPADDALNRLTGLAHSTATHLQADLQTRGALVQVATELAKHYSS